LVAVSVGVTVGELVGVFVGVGVVAVSYDPRSPLKIADVVTGVEVWVGVV
jgi:hypothetical protein